MLSYFWTKLGCMANARKLIPLTFPLDILLRCLVWIRYLLLLNYILVHFDKAEDTYVNQLIEVLLFLKAINYSFIHPLTIIHMITNVQAKGVGYLLMPLRKVAFHMLCRCVVSFPCQLSSSVSLIFFEQREKFLVQLECFKSKKAYILGMHRFAKIETFFLVNCCLLELQSGNVYYTSKRQTNW